MISRKPMHVRSEEPVSSHINIVSHYDDVTLLDKSDKLIQIIRLNGLDCISNDDLTLDIYKARINNLLKSFTSEFALYCWEVRRRVADYPAGNFPEGYSKELNERYQANIQSANMFKNELYLAIITKQPEGLINRIFSLSQAFGREFDKQARREYLARRYLELCDMTRKIMNGMSGYGCELLSLTERNGVTFSEPLQFLSQIINIDSHSVPMVTKDAATLISRKRLSFNNRSGVVEFRGVDGSSRFAAMLAIKGYSERTAQGMLDEIGKVKCEYLITQSYRFYDRENAKVKVRDQQMEMAQTQDTSVSQTVQLDDTFDDAASGKVGVGLHHFTMACYANTLEELKKNVAIISSKLSDLDITCVREEVACECAFWAQLPGNFGYALRSVPISTRNMAGFASFHNYHRGKLLGNYWGEAVTVLETLAGTPYYFNFHYKDVGNFLVFGAMGSGKTMLIGFLIAQSMKFGGKRVIFDKDRGLEIFVRAMNGHYERIKPGVPTGFNPCQLEDTAENRAFLASLLSRMLTVNNESLTAADIELISQAIDGMYRMPKPSRRFYHMASLFGLQKAGSLRNRFDQWHNKGKYAWLFDSETDSLNLDRDLLGFDLDSILNEPDCKIPALMYLIYRVQQSMAGQRGMIFFDEGWNSLKDAYMRDFINNLARISRKKNIIFGMATQLANDLTDSTISRAINESAYTKIFAPNPSADRSVYMDNFGLTEHQYRIVKELPDDQFYFLIIHGHGANQESVVVRPNMSDMKDDIAIISGRESSLLLLDKIRADVGDDPAAWLLIFKSQIRNLS